MILDALDAHSMRNVKKQQKKVIKIWRYKHILLPLHSHLSNGALSERLGTGLQNRLRRFDSATHLKSRKSSKIYGIYFFIIKSNYFAMTSTCMPHMKALHSAQYKTTKL